MSVGGWGTGCVWVWDCVCEEVDDKEPEGRCDEEDEGVGYYCVALD